MRTISFLFLAAVGLLVLLPADESSGQGKFAHGGIKPAQPIVRPMLPTPSIRPTPVYKPFIVKPVQPVFVKPVQPIIVKPVQPIIKFPTYPTVVAPIKPVVVTPPKTVVVPSYPGKVIVGSGTAPIHQPVIHQPINNWTSFPKQAVVVTPPKHVGVVKFTPEYRKTFQTAVIKRPPIVNGKNLNFVSVKHYEPHGVMVRNHFQPIQHTWFTNNWWNSHHIANYPHWHYYNAWNRHPWNYWWRPATWPILSGWYPYAWGQPFYYDYGSNVIVQNNQVLVNDVPVGSSQDYAQQAFEIADAPPPPPQ